MVAQGNQLASRIVGYGFRSKCSFKLLGDMDGFWVRWMEKFHSSKWQITNFESKEKLLALTHEPDL